jgi:hypothetical protein
MLASEFSDVASHPAGISRIDDSDLKVFGSPGRKKIMQVDAALIAQGPFVRGCRSRLNHWPEAPCHGKGDFHFTR